MIFHAILITGADLLSRIAKAQSLAKQPLTPHPDVLVIEGAQSIGIDKIRDLSRFLSRKAYQNPLKIVFISEAEKLTLPGQNALLKTLEEPPGHSQLILTAAAADQLLATVVSRCQVYHLPAALALTPAAFEQAETDFKQIVEHNLAQRVNLASQTASSPNAASDFCRQQLLFVRQLILKNQRYDLAALLDRLNHTLILLQANVNPKLALEELFFSYPKGLKTDKIDKV